MNFQDTLREHIRTAEKAHTEVLSQITREQIAAEQTVADIKRALTHNAQEGKYSVQDGKTTVSCLCRIPQRFLLRSHKNNGIELEQEQKKPRFLQDPTLVYRTWDCFAVAPQLSHAYHSYIEAVETLAAQENIHIEAVIHDATADRVYPFPTQTKDFCSAHCYLCIRATTVIS